jgi:hypothetical protein
VCVDTCEAVLPLGCGCVGVMDFVLIVLICCSFNHTDILYAHRFFTIIIYEFIFFLCCRLYTALKFSWLSTYSDLFCSVLVYLTSPHVVRASISSRFAISLLSIHSRRSISITSQLFHPPFRINWYMNTLKFWLFSLIHLVLWLHRRLTKFVVPHVSYPLSPAHDLKNTRWEVSWVLGII